MIDYKDLGSRVRALRRDQGMTQETLAEKVGLSTSFLGHIERGSRIASLETLVMLCNTLKVSPQELLAASLEDDLSAHMPATFSAAERMKLSSFLRMACDALDNWAEDDFV